MGLHGFCDGILMGLDGDTTANKTENGRERERDLGVKSPILYGIYWNIVGCVNQHSET